jgi:DNA-binding NarL/FixJ family response regulator
MAPNVWVDDRNTIFRRGLVSSLRSGGYCIAGESSSLHPEPDLTDAQLLIFDVDDTGLARASTLAHGHDLRLIGLLREPREDQLYELLTAGLDGVLDRDELTPSRLTACVQAVIEGSGSAPPVLLAQLIAGLARGAPGGAVTRGLARREVDVLRLLATGGSTREIAEHLAYSERTVKNIVHDLLVKLNCRTRAHAVGLATRQGVI